jgi:hypothetical protein
MMVITATRATAKTMTWIGERRGGRERNLIINGWPIFGANLASNGCVTFTVVSQVTSKKETHKSASWLEETRKNVFRGGKGAVAPRFWSMINFNIPEKGAGYYSPPKYLVP